jgi:hypothetical protein
VDTQESIETRFSISFPAFPPQMNRTLLKGAQTSNWAAPRLSAAQITYAATDAWVCRELFLHFQTLGMLTK